MRKILPTKVLLSVIFSLICNPASNNSYAKERPCIPLIWNMGILNHIKSNTQSYSKTISKIVDTSNQYTKSLPLAVTNKKMTFAPDKHTYCSLGSYYWPNPNLLGGPYITKDGQINPEYYEYDVERLAEMTRRCLYLSLAYFITEDIKYYDAYIKQLKVWFIDEETYMKPNFDYAGIAPGHDNNLGRCSGIIQAYVFNNIIESIRLVRSMGKLDNLTFLSLKKWFGQFVYWAENNRFSRALVDNVKNNIGLAYDVLLINLYLFVENENRAKEIADRFLETRVNVQIDENGMQKEELKRTKAFSYSIENLTHILDFYCLTQYWNDCNYWKQQNRIDRAFSFLRQYVCKEREFPYQQITNWDRCYKDFEVQFERLNRLKKKQILFPKEVNNPISIYILIQ